MVNPMFLGVIDEQILTGISTLGLGSAEKDDQRSGEQSEHLQFAVDYSRIVQR